MQKKILTINEMFSDNIGDQAIAGAMYKFCKLDEVTQVDSVDFSFRLNKQHCVSAISKKGKAKAWRSFVPLIFKKYFLLLRM